MTIKPQRIQGVRTIKPELELRSLEQQGINRAWH